MQKVNFEKIFFIFINFCFTSLGAFLIFRFTAILSTQIIVFLHHVDPMLTDNSSRDFNLLIGSIGFDLLYYLFKFICFLVLYKCKEQFPYIHSFFDRFRLDRKFMWKILGIALLIDTIFCIFLWKMPILILFFIITGSILGYLIFLLFFHPVREDKIVENGSITQGRIAKIMTNIFIWIVLLLMIFVFILIALVFIV